MMNDKREILDDLCTCGHPSVNHCCTGSFSSDGMTAHITTNSGSCLACEAEACAKCDIEYGEDNHPCHHGGMKHCVHPDTCDEFHYKADIHRGDEYHKKFQALFDEMDEENRRAKRHAR